MAPFIARVLCPSEKGETRFFFNAVPSMSPDDNRVFQSRQHPTLQRDRLQTRNQMRPGNSD